MTESGNKTRNRNEQRKARQLAAGLGIKYTAALRMVRQETAAQHAPAVQDARRPSTAPTSNNGRAATGTAPQFLAPGLAVVADGARR